MLGTNLYLSHPWKSRAYIREWELYIEKTTGINLFNPFYDEPRPEVAEIDAGTRKDYDLDYNLIVQRDLAAIKKCEGIVAIVDGGTSYGTIMEIVYAFNMGKPVYLICTNAQEKHPWLRYHCLTIFTSFKEFESCLVPLLGPL